MSVSLVTRLLDALHQVTGQRPSPTGSGWQACCPAHEDRRPSLSVSAGEGGRVLLKCHAGCTTEAVVTALGLTLRDLMPAAAPPPASGTKSVPNPAGANRQNRQKPRFASAEEALADLRRRYGTPSGRWDYHDADGRLVGVVVRWDRPGGKDYRPVSLAGDGWGVGGMPEPRPLYALPRLAGRRRVYICEGKKACEAAWSIGLAATTSPHGAQSAGKADWSPLAGLEVIIFPDNNQAGEEYAAAVVRLLAALDPPPAVKVVRLPDLPDGGDLYDFVEARDAAEPEALREAVEALADAAAPVEFHPALGEDVPPPGGEGWPEPQPLPEELPPVPPFDDALLPDVLRPHVADVAERIQCPPDFPAVAAMTVLAGIVGRRVGIRPRRQDDWLVVPNLWGAVIGRPGIMKTPAIAEPLKALRRLEVEGKADYERDQKAYKAAELLADARRELGKKAMKDAIKQQQKDDSALARAEELAESLAEGQPEAPVRRRYMVNDTTVEKFGELLSENDNGLTQFRDELAGFLASLDKEGNEAARAFYLEAWNGTGRFTYDRIGRGTIDIEAAIVSILGGIQPGPLQAYLRDALRGGRGDDGLMQRFQLLVWPDVSKDWRNVDRFPDTEAKRAAWGMYRRLAELDPEAVHARTDEHDPDGIPFLRFSLLAQSEFDRWRETLERRVRSGEEHPAMEAHLAKYRSLVPSLALLIHLADGTPGAVTAEALRKALGWAEYLEAHARRVYSVAILPAVSAARAVTRRIARGDLKDGFTAREIYHKGWSGLTEAADVAAALELLVELDWLRAEEEETGGRPKVRHRINPRCRPEAREADKTDESQPEEPFGGSVGAAPEGSAPISDEWGTL